MRDYALLEKAFRHCAEGGLCADCPMYDNCPDLDCKKNAADAIEELLAVVPHWISVEDALPDVVEKVITYNGNFVSENWLCTVASKDGKINVWAYSEGFVTHWMPLPSTEGLK
jgi:hypothetical protein